jgi:cytochrome c
LAGSSPSLAAGDAAAGKQTFTTTCGVCHSTEPGVSKIGPSLAGIVGSKSGAAPGYNFSPALKGANITWDEQTLDKFLENPSADVHGTKMVISVPNAEHRQDHCVSQDAEALRRGTELAAKALVLKGRRGPEVGSR